MRIDPVSPDMQAESAAAKEAAISLMRQKVAKAFGEAPAATEQMAASIADKTPSKHQLFMRDLAASGKSLAEIQTDWHRYYTMLPDADKREVWQEFYDANQHTPYTQLFQKQAAAGQTPQPAPGVSSTPSVTAVTLPQPLEPTPKRRPATTPAKKKAKTKAGKTAQKIQTRIRKTVDASERLGVKQHLQSLWFGVRVGIVVLVIMLFGFFNEMFIAPFIQPSRKVTDTPIIMSNTAVETAAPTIIVPKINIQIPIDFNVASIDEGTVQASLKGGVVHYPSTVKPGQNGNGAYFGHSSQNLFNNGKYKYAFVLLHQITTGDVFYITYQGKVYAYQVFAREVVKPTQVSVINDTKGKQATATLITCDPPGLSTNRLVIWGEQISPSVASNTAPEAPTDGSLAPAQLTGKGDSAWTRFVQNLQFWRPEDTQ